MNNNIKKKMHRWMIIGTLGVMGFGSMGLVGGTAHARKSTVSKYGAIAGAAAAGYGLVEKKNNVAIAGAAVAAGSYYMNKKAKKDEAKKQREEAWYRRRYGRNWQRHYRR